MEQRNSFILFKYITGRGDMEGTCLFNVSQARKLDGMVQVNENELKLHQQSQLLELNCTS